MNSLLIQFSFIFFIITIGVLLNEKFFKIPTEIALLCFSLLGSIIIKILTSTNILPPGTTMFEQISTINLNKFLMDGVLCFMLFAGASDMRIKTFVKYSKQITLYALLTTVITTLLYGGIFYLLCVLFNTPISPVYCFLLGAIVSPTDPIAATGILNKLGLPEDIFSIMAGESLFNDGVGVALFLFFSAFITGESEGGFAYVMIKELFGAIITATIISLFCLFLLRKTQNKLYHVIISLFAVTACYTICDMLGFSGVIASVVCGIFFGSYTNYMKEQGLLDTKDTTYEVFWGTVDKLLNYVLYVFIGISFLFIVRVEFALIVILAVVVINFITRYSGVFVSTCFLKETPGGYNKNRFSILMSWSGLKGGLSLALIISIASILPADIYEKLLFVVFTTIIFTTIVQGLTVDKLYLKMKKRP